MLRKSIAIPVFAAAVIAPLASTGAASAAPAAHHVTVRALTQVSNRPDGGNAGYWADDTMTRVLTITQTGGAPGAWTFTAKLADDGSFTTIKGALAPNQGPGFAGDVINSRVTGGMTGYADYSFTASELPSTGRNAGVPARENDHGNIPADDTSTWYELAFPAGTVFSGTGITTWGWTYHTVVLVRAFPFLVRQQWTDSYDNGYGDLTPDGQITG